MKVGFIGLGAMGIGMAQNIIKAGHDVSGFDIAETAMQALVDAGGVRCQHVNDVSQGADVLVVMVVNSKQARQVLFEQGAADALPKGAVVFMCPTMLPSEAKSIGEQLLAQQLLVIDGPVSGGKAGADAGKLSVMAAGTDAAFDKAKPVLDAVSKKVFRVGSEPGMGSTYKVVHQLAAGVNLAVMGEVMAFGVRAGCDAQTLFDIVSVSAGQSWMFNDRTPSLLDEDYSPRSAVDIFVKDMGLVLQTGEQVQMELPLAETARKLFVAASEAGYGRLNDAAVVKVYEDQSGVNVARSQSGLKNADDS